MSRIQRTAPSPAKGLVNAEEETGVDPTGKKDSTTGLLNSYQKAINKNLDWYVPGGQYVIGEGGKGFDISTLEWPLKTKNTTGVTTAPPKIFCATTAWWRAHPNIKAKHLVEIKSPQTANVQQFGVGNFQFGRLSGPGIHATGNYTKESKVVTGIVNTAPLELFIGQKVEGGSIPGGTTLAKIINTTEVEFSAAPTLTETATFRAGPALESAALYMGPGVIDSNVYVQSLEEALYGLLCESAAESAEIKIGWMANTTFNLPFIGNNGYGVYLKSPAEGPSFGTQGNRYIMGETIGGKWGIVVDDAIKQNSRFNKFDFNVIETMTEGCILDRNGSTNFVGNYLGIAAVNKNYVLEEGAVGIPYVRAYMIEQVGYTAIGREGIDLINYKTKVGTASITIPTPTQSSVRNQVGRPVIAVIQLTPKATKLSSNVKTGEKVFNLTGATAAGWIAGKTVTFSALPTGVTTPAVNQPFYIVSPEFTPTANTKLTETKINLTGAKAKGFTNGTHVTFAKITSGVTTLVTGTTYWVKTESEEGFELSATEAGTAIKVEGHELETATTAVKRSLINGFELAEKQGGTPITVEGAELTTAGTEFSTPNLHWQLTGNTEIGTTTIPLKGARTKGFQLSKISYPRYARFIRVTPGITGLSVSATLFIVGNEIVPTSETKVGETKVNFKTESAKRFPNNLEIQFNKTPVGTTIPVKNKTYFVVETEAEGFKFAETEGGAAVAVAGAALNTTETAIVRPNIIEVSSTENGTPFVIEGAKMDLSTTEINTALINIEKAGQWVEGEGTTTVTIPVNAQISLGVYQCKAEWATSGGT